MRESPLPPVPPSPAKAPGQTFSPSSLQSFLGELLAEQQRLDTPVAQFAAAQEAGNIALRPQLIPLSKPKPGEQYAFEVDLDSCTGCKACVSACHALNGLDDTETWRDVGVVVSADPRHPFQQTVTTACHHCADPACANGCPVLAYEKDPVTGIVRHLDDQCIGCSYCVLKCPYDVPKYNSRLGIVRKCDMCHGRLAAGEAPACVQACPTHAIKITLVPIATAAAPVTENKAPSDISDFLPSAPDPRYTYPTTKYVTKRTLPSDLRPGDVETLRPQPAHWPLVGMLTFLPFAIGTSVLSALPILQFSPFNFQLRLVALATGAIGLAISVLHLGQPLRAWRIFLGLRKSWLSREAVLFGAWFGLLATAQFTALPLKTATAITGTIALFCSGMIYVDTQRRAWRAVQTLPRFFGTGAVLALATAFALHPSAVLGATLVGTLLAKLALELRALSPLNHDEHDDPVPALPTGELMTARLLAGPLRVLFSTRLILALLGGTILPLAVAAHAAPPVVAWLTLSAIFAGELTERLLFFRSVDAPKMPGVPA